jgi:hypothetical protein
MQVSNAEQLHKVKRAIEMVPGVIKVERVKHLPSGFIDDSLDTED